MSDSPQNPFPTVSSNGVPNRWMPPAAFQGSLAYIGTPENPREMSTIIPDFEVYCLKAALAAGGAA